MTTTQPSELIAVGDAQLYTQVQGSGPAVLLIPGAAGDAGQYDELARRLAAGHTVVTYDRRSNSRSVRSDGWEQTTVEQHAGDAAGLIEALGLEPAAVFGNSTGALIALATALRFPDAVRTVVLHEPTLMGVLADPESAMASVQPVIAAGMERGGLPGGAAAFLEFAAGDAWTDLPDAVKNRMIGNAEVLFQTEFGSFMSWVPDDAALDANRVPATVLTATETAPFFREAAEWVSRRLDAPLVEVPGGHMGFLAHPDAFAAALRPALG